MGTDELNRACSDWKRGNGFQLEEVRVTLDKRKIVMLYHQGSDRAVWVAHIAGKCSIHGNMQGQAGQSSEQPGLADVPAHCWALGQDNI